MTPREYIAALKAQSPNRQLAEKDFSPEFLANLRREGHDVARALDRKKTVDFAENLLSLLHPRLPIPLRQIFSDGLMAVGGIADARPNAYLENLGYEGYAIIFNSGLKDFIYRVARVLATRVHDNSGSIDLAAQSPPITETARIVVEIFWWLKRTRQSFGPSYSIQHNQIHFANFLALDAETFLLAHEIGHAIADASEHSNPLFRDIDPALHPMYSGEHKADAIALALVMEFHNPKAKLDPIRAPLIYAGVELALQIYAMLEHTKIIVNRSHPPSASRLAFIRSVMKERCDSEESWRSLSMLSVGIGHIFSSIQTIYDEREKHTAFYNQQAAQVVQELDGLLIRCTGGFVTDYMSFDAEAGKIFNRGYAHEILATAAVIASEFFALPKEPTLEKQQAWIRAQKFKLLFRFVLQSMNEPARSLFLRTLEAPYHDA